MGATAFLESADYESGAPVSQEGTPNETMAVIIYPRSNALGLVARLEQGTKVRTLTNGREGAVGRERRWQEARRYAAEPGECAVVVAGKRAGTSGGHADIPTAEPFVFERCE